MHFFKKKPSKRNREPVTAIIPAAGSSRRMGGENKLLLPLGGIPVLIRTLQVFESLESIDKIILVCREEDIPSYFALCKEYDLHKVYKITKGGKTRAESVLAGILACPQDTSWIAVHDAARPFITEDIINETIEKAQVFGAAAPTVPLKDSIKQVEDGKITANVQRDLLAAVQTPQIFKKEVLRQALEQIEADQVSVTDDCGAVEYIGISVAVSQGSYENIKITTPEDLYLGEAILAHREES